MEVLNEVIVAMMIHLEILRLGLSCLPQQKLVLHHRVSVLQIQKFQNGKMGITFSFKTEIN